MNKEQQVKEMLLDIPQKIVTYGGIPAGQHLYCEQRQEIAEALYNAGYRKTFTSNTQKAYKEDYIKGIEETEAEIERLKADNEALQMLNNASAETIQKLFEANDRFASNMKSVLEIEKKNATKELVEKLKEKYGRSCSEYYPILTEITSDDFDELLKEYEI